MQKTEDSSTKVRQVPYEPIALWLTWATVFVAQGLSHWINDFTVISGDNPDDDSLSVEDHFERRKTYFIGEVLASAVIHSQGLVDAHGKQNPYPNIFSLLRDTDSNTFNGRLAKQDLLREALCDGKSLPFRTKHSHAKFGDKFGYELFKIKLQRVTEGMPDKFGISILDFDVERLEWLAILLHFGVYSMEQKRQYYVGHMDIAVSRTDSSSSSKTGTDGDLVGHEKSEDNSHRNLLRQLGVGVTKESHDHEILASEISTIYKLSAFPLDEQLFEVGSISNRLSLKSSEYIDSWISLLAGEDVKSLQENDPIWKEVFDPDEKLGWMDQKKSFHESFQTIFDYNKAMEVYRLDFQFTRVRHRHQHLENSLTFMGYSMEVARSLLAELIKKHGWAGCAHYWDISNRGSGESSDSNLFFVGQLSNPVAIGIQEVDINADHSVTWLKVCILKELQDMCYEQLVGGDNETGKLLMILCIISFPSTVINFEETDYSSHVSVVSSKGSKNSIAIQLENQSKGRRVQGTITAPGAPQCISVIFNIDLSLEKKSMSKVSIGLSYSDGEGKTFKWDRWRDAFVGRLEGKEKWQSSHGLYSSSLHPTRSSIEDGISEVLSPFGGTGSSFQTWRGWLPFRPEIAIFELKSPQFLFQRQKSRSYFFENYTWIDNSMSVEEFSHESHETVPYLDARPDILRHASLTISERLFHSPDDSHEDRELLPQMIERNERNIRLLMSKAQKLLLQPDAGVERAIFLLEVGATEYGMVEALEKCIHLLLQQTKKPSQIARATRVLTKYLTIVERQPCKTVEDIENRNNTLEAVVPIFQRILKLDKLSVNVLPHFVSFVRLIPNFWSSGEAKYQLKCDLKQAFMYCLDLRLITNLSEITFVKQRCWERIQDGDGYVKIVKNRHGHEVHKVMIRKVRDYFPWKEETEMRLKRMYLERVVEERPDSKSLTSLAHILRTGENGVNKDWSRADQMYERALAHQFRPDSVYYRGVMAMDGENGIEKDEYRAIQFFENAKISGYEDRPTIAKQLVKLKRGDYGEREVDSIVQSMVEIAERSQSTMVIYNVARILVYGVFGATKDLDTAKRLYTKAMKLGDVDSMNMLNTVFYEGIERDTLTALGLHSRTVVEKQDFTSLNDLAVGITFEENVETDYRLVIDLYEMCVKAGYRNAAHNLVSFLSNYLYPAEFQDIDKAISIGRGLLKEESEPKDQTLQILAIALLNSREPGQNKEGVQILEGILEHGQLETLNHVGLLARYYSHQSDSQEEKQRAHYLYERIISEVSVIEPVLLTASVDGGFRDLTMWEGENRTEIPISWDKIRLLWHAATGPSQYYFSALYNVAKNYKEGRFGISVNESKANETFQKLMSFIKWYTDSKKYLLAYAILGGELDFSVDMNVIKKLGFEVALRGTDDDEKLEMAKLLLKSNARYESDPRKGVKLLEDIVSAATVPFSHIQNRACLFLSETVINGIESGEPDVGKAIDLLNKAIELGNSQHCMITLGSYYQKGSHGIDKDYTKARLLFEKALYVNDNPELTDLAMSSLHVILTSEPNNMDFKRIAVSIWEKHIEMFPIGSRSNEYLLTKCTFRMYLAFHLLKGMADVVVDEVRAVKLLEEAIGVHTVAPNLESGLALQKERCKEMLCVLYLIAPGKITRNEPESFKLFHELRGDDLQKPIVLSVSKELGSLSITADLKSNISPRWNVTSKYSDDSETDANSSITFELSLSAEDNRSKEN